VFLSAFIYDGLSNGEIRLLSKDCLEIMKIVLNRLVVSIRSRNIKKF
jgi:hypothetical protein